MTSYRKTMREAREEMLQSLNESNLEKMRKAAKGAKQTLKMKDGSIGMDSFTASAIMQIYDKVNDKNRKTMENLLKDGKKADIVKLMKFAMSKVNAEYVPEEFEEEFELSEGSVEFLDHDASDKDFIALAKKHKLKVKSDGEDTVATGDPKNIEKLLQTMYGDDWKDMYSVKGGKYTEEEVKLDEAKYTRKLMKDKSVVDYVKSQQEKNRKRGRTPQDGAVYHGANWVDIAADAIGMDKMSLSKKKAFDWDSEYEAVAKKLGEEVELDEAKYDLYHKDFSSAMQHAYKMAKKMYGITVDPEEIDDKVASGPKKPSEGKTNTYRLKGDKGAIQVQVYNKGGSKPFELNMYKEEVELDEKLDKEDEPIIKKVVKMLKKASGAHAGQAKDLEKAMTEEDEIDEGKMSQLHQLIKDGKSAKEIAKIMKLDVKTIQALMDEKSELEEKRHRDVDPADIDTSATDDDIKAADKNIMMQLRKSVSLRGQFPVEFLDKKKVKIPQRIAQAVIAKYNGLRKPMDKEVFQSKIAKSHRDLLMALKEGFASDAQRRAAFAQGYKAKGKKDKKEDIDETGYVGGKDPMPAGKELAKLIKKRRKGKKESTLERMNKKLQEKKDG